jgi:nucleoside 2-deoxyribosyltransferase
MRIYLASPFFNPEQVAVVERIENLLTELKIDFYSPRKDGVLMNMTPEERKASTKRIFDKNVLEINKSSMILAVIDGKDTGTVWEIGYSAASGIPIITYTDHGYGVNVMLKECVVAHVKGVDRLRDLLNVVICHGYPYKYLLSEFNDFSEDVT